MKKILIAAAALLAASNVFAVGTATSPTKYAIGEDTSATGVGQPEVFTYTALDDRAGYVKNDFDFTMSAWSIARVLESDDARQMSVGGVSVRGRGMYTGNSDGGSVSQCGKLLSAADAKTLSKVLALLDQTSTESTASSGCVPAE